MSHRYAVTGRSSGLALLGACVLVALTSIAAHAGEAPAQTSVYFGDVHLHTALSTDAGGGGTRLMPRDAYRFARGEKVKSSSGLDAQLARPLDFLAVADHTDGLGVITDIFAGTPNVMADPRGRELHEAFVAGGERARKAVVGMIADFSQGNISPALNYQPGNPAYRRTWEKIVAAADEYNEPGRFTALVGFEWTSLVKGNNLHRVVLMRDGGERAKMIEPYLTSPPLGSTNPRDLWRWMTNWEEKTGGQILAIPHNGNLSNGMMFPLVDDFDGGKPLDDQYLRTRARWEPVVEVTQDKGDGEAHPLLSPNDEFADYETWDSGNLDLSQKKTPEMLPGEYARSALRRGLELAARTGVNPYKFGMIGSTDAHTGLSSVDDDNFFGKAASDEPSARRALRVEKTNEALGLQRDGWRISSAGLVAAWAPANTREAIFDALERREVYATTGTRIRVRLFGGWGFKAKDAARSDWTEHGYRAGVPMGGDLPPRKGARAPTFLVSAMRDPAGANLDRVQIIKGWLAKDGQSHEKVYDVAWGGADKRKPGRDGKLPPVGDTVDLAGPSYTNTIGAAELSAVWKDPDFDPAQHAFYYARVIEIPTPRWTAYDRVRFNLDLPASVPLKTQERAYTSPIWYTP